MTDYPGNSSPRVDLTKRNGGTTPPVVPPTPVTPPPAGPRHGAGGRPPSGSRRWLGILAGVLALLLIGGISTVLLLTRGDEPAAAPSAPSSRDAGDADTEPDSEQDPGTVTDEPSEDRTETPEPVDTDADAASELDEIVAADEATSSALEGVWTAQLASSAAGESPTTILGKYRELKARYPGAVLIWSGDWPGSFGPSSLQSWVVLSGDDYSATRPLLEWCASEGWSDGQCWAKRLATSGDDPLLNTDRSPADDRNN